MPPVRPRGGIRTESFNAFCWSVFPLVVGVLVFAVFFLTAGAHAHRMVATIGHPAVVAVAGRGHPDGAGRFRIVITIAAYTPASDGSVVEIVVRTMRRYCGAGREIGRFSIFPNEAFSASEPDKAQSFGLELPQDALVGSPSTVSVSLEIARGKGMGARVEVGDATIE